MLRDYVDFLIYIIYILTICETSILSVIRHDSRISSKLCILSFHIIHIIHN